MHVRYLSAAATLLSTLSQTPCIAEPPNEACVQLKGNISAVDIGLPTRGASIQSAELVAPEPLKASELPFGPLPPYLAVVPATPEYCKVTGEIAPVDEKAPPIRFEVNLPTKWNGSSVQFGGGGFNGTLITGLGLPPLARADQPSPLAQGFVTYGTDSGHQTEHGKPPQTFALNDEALVNFAYASYKKVRDTAVELMQRRYGRKPAKLYFVGFSEGGREGLTMAQQFPNDFDGILSGVPVINWVGLQSAGTRVGAAQFNGGWLDPERVKLFNDAVLAACDRLDGLADGIVSNYEACKRAFDITKLVCKAGAQPPDGQSLCLSRAQLEAVRLMHSELDLGFAVANGVHTYPGWGLGGEAAQGSGTVGGWVSWQTGVDAPTLPPGRKNSRAWLYGSGAVQYFFARDPNFDASKFDPARFVDRMKRVSSLMDSTNPDLSKFAAHGGKLIMYENMADYAQSPDAGIEYYKSVIAAMGTDKVDNFLQLLVLPGADHLGTGAPASVDLMEPLVAWVEKDQKPAKLVVAAQQPKAPFTVTATRPLCRYPSYPQYTGGDANSAQSFQCKAH